MMTEVEILLTNEMRCNGAYIGRVEWTDRVAELDGAGTWVRRDNEPAVACDHEDILAEVRATLRGDAPDAEKIRVLIELLDGEDWSRAPAMRFSTLMFVTPSLWIRSRFAETIG
jgi:hypothetical protein